MSERDVLYQVRVRFHGDEPIIVREYEVTSETAKSYMGKYTSPNGYVYTERFSKEDEGKPKLDTFNGWCDGGTLYECHVTREDFEKYAVPKLVEVVKDWLTEKQDHYSKLLQKLK